MVVLFNEFGCDEWCFRPAVRPWELDVISPFISAIGLAVSTRAQMAYQDSAQSLVRALRAPTDPPRQGGSSKIDIASEAWHETSFYVPRKAETILEWCLTRLLKDGTRPA
jgi:hypothetical protein